MTRIGLLFSMLLCVSCASINSTQDNKLMLSTHVSGSHILSMKNKQAIFTPGNNHFEMKLERDPDNLTLTNDIRSLNPIRFEISSALTRLSDSEYSMRFTCTLDYLKSVVINQNSEAADSLHVSGDIEKSHNVSEQVTLTIDQPHAVLLPNGIKLTLLIEPYSRYVWEQVKAH